LIIGCELVSPRQRILSFAAATRALPAVPIRVVRLHCKDLVSKLPPSPNPDTFSSSSCLMTSKGGWWKKFAKSRTFTPKLDENEANLSPLRPWSGDPLDLRLPVELWFAIIDYVERADLKSLSRTARRLREIALRQLFHKISVAARSTDLATRIRPLQDAKHILEMVRIVRITGYNQNSASGASSDFFAALRCVMRQMSGLEHLKISYAYIEPSFYEEIFYLQSLKTLELSSCTLASRETGPKNPPPPVMQTRLTSISFGWGVGTPGNIILASSYSTLEYLNLQGLFTFHPTDPLIVGGPFPNLHSFETTEYLRFSALQTFFSINPTLTTLKLWWRSFPAHIEIHQLGFAKDAGRPLLPNLINLTCMGDLAEVLIPCRPIKRLHVWKVKPSVVRQIGETRANTYESLILSMSSLGWDALSVDLLGKESAPLVQGLVEFTLSVTDVTVYTLLQIVQTLN
jgi:hypothetical protein